MREAAPGCGARVLPPVEEGEGSGGKRGPASALHLPDVGVGRRRVGIDGGEGYQNEGRAG